MEFTYEAYAGMISLLRRKGFRFTDYQGYHSHEKPCIMRHDVDFDLGKAGELARLEHKEGIKATYFILISSDFYNVCSRKNTLAIHEIYGLGHSIGLHFDEKKYSCQNIVGLRELIHKEVRMLEAMIDIPVRAVSMHRPSPSMLAADLQLDGCVNSYGAEFFQGFKYLSDSRMYWREDLEAVLDEGKEKRLHILTHPFWYSHKEESMRDKLMAFIGQSRVRTYEGMDDNFRDLGTVIRREEICGK